MGESVEMKNTITLALDGDVTIGDFSTALNQFTALINQLTFEVADEANIEWIVEELYASSAITTIHGFHEEESKIINVVNAYEDIGEALVSGLEIPFSHEVKRNVKKLTDVLNGRITSIRFETSEKDFFISSKPEEGFKSKPTKYSYGTVKGTVQSLSMRRDLKFTLWDALFDKPINCYLKTGQEEEIRAVWGKRAVVKGNIGRQPETGYPIVVREITEIRTLVDLEPGSYRRAKGVIPWKEGDDTPEEIIGRYRDA